MNAGGGVRRVENDNTTWCRSSNKSATVQRFSAVLIQLQPQRPPNDTIQKIFCKSVCPLSPSEVLTDVSQMCPPPMSAYAQALTSVRRRENQGHGKVKQPQHWMWVNNISFCYVKIWTAAATLNTVCLCPADFSSRRLQRKPSSHVPRATRECHAEQ